MQKGVAQSAVVLLLLSEGIFHAHRQFVWDHEVKYGIENCEKAPDGAQTTQLPRHQMPVFNHKL